MVLSISLKASTLPLKVPSLLSSKRSRLRRDLLQDLHKYGVFISALYLYAWLMVMISPLDEHMSRCSIRGGECSLVSTLTLWALWCGCLGLETYDWGILCWHTYARHLALYYSFRWQFYWCLHFISLPSAFSIKGETNQTKLQQQAGNSPPSTNNLGLSSHQSAHLGKFLILCHSYVTLMHQFLQQQLLNLISWHHHTLVPPAELAEWEQMFVILVVAK